MGVLSKGTTFSDGDGVTSSKLNSLVDSATFVTGPSGTTDDSSLEVNAQGRLQVKADGIQSSHLADSAVVNAAVANGAVTPAKLSTGGISWDTSGNVTTTGNLSATVTDSGVTATLTNQSSTAARTPGFSAVNYTGGYANSSTLYAGNVARGSSSSPAAPQSGDIFVRFIGRGYDTTGFQAGGYIDIVAAENWTSSAHGTNMLFNLKEAGGTTSGVKMTLTNSGNLNVVGSYSVDGDQVVGNRVTGWGAPTGTATRTTFATSTVTLEQLAQRVKALIDDLRTHGLIGN